MYPCPFFFQQWYFIPYNSKGCLCPLQLTFIFVVITSFSNAESATRGLIVEPGEYKPETVLFNRGFNGFFLISFHFFAQPRIKINLDQKMGRIHCNYFSSINIHNGN
ncbi:MAG: hypothetical protein CM1200mP13_04820 [Candidatus Pelagibacterales bacterium]|nr:MAG: hypothetical protein CM1200mP13_04820 [Pelagibacterales bacterium]